MKIMRNDTNEINQNNQFKQEKKFSFQYRKLNELD